MSGRLEILSTSHTVITVPCTDQAITGMIHKTMTAEYANATPLGPYGKPIAKLATMTGAMTRPIKRDLRTIPSEVTSHDNGFAIANTRIVGASKRKMTAADFHCGPRQTRIM